VSRLHDVHLAGLTAMIMNTVAQLSRFTIMPARHTC